MKNQKFSFFNRLKSIIFAWEGLKILIKEEHNARIHLIATLIVIFLGIYFELTKWEWIAIVLCIGFVIAMEAMNSAIENIADFIHPERHDNIKKIKDLSAAAVLISAIAAFIIGLIIFIPKILLLL